MSWKDILKDGEMPQPPKSRRLLEMTCENNHKFTLGETKIKKILGAKKYHNISRRCPVCGKKATFLEVKKGTITYDNEWSNRTYNKFLNQLRQPFYHYLKKDESGKFNIEGKSMDETDIANHLKNFAKPKYQSYVNGYSEQEREEITASLLDSNSTFIGHFLKFLRKTGDL